MTGALCPAWRLCPGPGASHSWSLTRGSQSWSGSLSPRAPEMGGLRNRKGRGRAWRGGWRGLREVDAVLVDQPGSGRPWPMG